MEVGSLLIHRDLKPAAITNHLNYATDALLAGTTLPNEAWPGHATLLCTCPSRHFN